MSAPGDQRPALKLTRAERRQVFAGTLKVLRREQKPDLEPGQDFVVSSTRGGRQILDRATGATVEIDPVPRLWITIKGWHLRAGQTEWETEVTIHDHREHHRVLANGIGGMPREPGLRTRWGTRVVHRNGEVKVVTKTVPKKGEQGENWTPETERGYGGRDELEYCEATGTMVPAAAVDDDTLKEFADAALTENLKLQAQRREQERGMRKEMAVARENRRGQRQRARAATAESQPVAA